MSDDATLPERPAEYRGCACGFMTNCVERWNEHGATCRVGEMAQMRDTIERLQRELAEARQIAAEQRDYVYGGDPRRRVALPWEAQ